MDLSRQARTCCAPLTCRNVILQSNWGRAVWGSSGTKAQVRVKVPQACGSPGKEVTLLCFAFEGVCLKQNWRFEQKKGPKRSRKARTSPSRCPEQRLTLNCWIYLFCVVLYVSQEPRCQMVPNGSFLKGNLRMNCSRVTCERLADEPQDVAKQI